MRYRVRQAEDLHVFNPVGPGDLELRVALALVDVSRPLGD